MQKLRKYISVLLCIALFVTGIGINGGIFDVSVYADDPTYTGTVSLSSGVLNVREGPGTDYNKLGTLSNGASVNIYGEKTNGWYKIGYGTGYGYVSADYITNVKKLASYDYDADFETNLSKQNFPESYKVLLRQLHVEHPNWIFKADHLSMTWEEAVAAESKVGKSLVQNGYVKDSWKSMAKDAYNWSTGSYVSYDTGGWVTAERDVVEYYMEPRNFLNENDIFVFLDQSYDSSVQNADGLQKILNGTFMEGGFPEDTYDTYNDIIMYAAKNAGVSPYVLAASIIIEQGRNGTGASISGTQSGYEGYYNYFNIRAYADEGYSAVAYGLLYAMGGKDGTGTSYGRPWNTRAKSIIGGSQYYATGYVKRGQDTLYYKKFNVIAPSYYANQYMTNVQAAYKEAAELKDAYSSVNADAALTFSIPVYKDMPSSNTTALPTSSGANNYYLTGLAVDGVTVNGFSMYQNEYELMVDSNVSSVSVTASVPSGASVSGTGKKNLSVGKNTVSLTVKAASGKTAKYTLSIYREEGSGTVTVPEPTVEGKYTIGSYVSGVAIGTSVSDFISGFGVKNGTAAVLNSNGAKKASGSIATGDKVVVYNNEGTEKLRLNIVIFGDTNGDGKVSIVDLARVQKHLLETSTLSGVQNSAADVNHDGKISILDLARVQKHLLEITTITQ